MGIYIKQTDGLQRLSGEKLTYQKIVSALGYVPFKGNYNDLTNKPITQDGNDNSFIIQDSSGNKIAQIDENGLVVTNVKAYNIYSNGVNLLEALNNLANDTTKIDQLQAQIDALPFSDYTNSDYLNICDKDNNPIARFDENGFTTTEILANAININHKYTDAEGNVVAENYDVGAEIKALKEEVASTPDDVVTEPELAAAIAKIPVTEQGNITSTSGEFAIQDPSGNKIMQVDVNGLTVPQIKATSANIGGIDVPNGLAPKEHTHQLTSLEGSSATPNKTYFILANKGNQSKPEWIEEDRFATADELKGVSDKVTTLIGDDDDANKSVRAIANDALAEALIPEDAQESLNTLEEIAAWIQDHPEDAAAMNRAIQENTDNIEKLTPRVTSVETKTKNISDEEEATLFEINDTAGNIAFQVNESSTVVNNITTKAITLHHTSDTGESVVVYDVGAEIHNLRTSIGGGVSPIADSTIASLVNAAFADK